MEHGPLQNNNLPSNWFEQAKQEVQKLLTEDYDNLMKGVAEEKKAMYEEMKKDATEKLAKLEEETKIKLQEAEQKSEFIRDDLIESIKEDYNLMKNRYLNWLRK